jgi:hypothetical protein
MGKVGIRMSDEESSWADDLRDYEVDTDSSEYDVDIKVPIREMKPKRGYKAGIYTPSPIDSCETPSYALDPLVPYIPKHYGIWEPAAGTGRMVRALERRGYRVLGSTIENGENFFDIEADGVDIIVTNPPFGIKFDWLERCYALGNPFALLLPVETIGAKRAQALIKEHGMEMLLLNRRVDFYMPNKGNAGSAQFPTFWWCHNVLPRQIICADLIKVEDDESVAV